MGNWIGYARLVRAPAVPTAAANVLMGSLVAHGEWQPLGMVAGLVAASVAIYAAGMVLNDVADLAVDRRERPGRPIPSGQVSPAAARRLGSGLLIAGLTLTWIVAAFDDSLRCGAIGSLLVIAVLAYNFAAKKYWFGSVILCGCRILNVLLGMSTGREPKGSVGWLGFSPLEWSVALGIGLFVAGIAWLARRETETVRGVRISGSGMLMLTALAWLSHTAWRLVDHRGGLRLDMPLGLMGLLGVALAVRYVVVWRERSPAAVQRGVAAALYGLIPIDAAICWAANDSPWYGSAVLLLLGASWALGRVAYAT